MDINDERDDPTDDSDVVADHRARAADMLSQIAQQARQGLADAGIDLSLFFLIPSSGQSIITFGTITDPDDHLWNRVGEIVSSIVRQTVGLDRTRCRTVTCATTDDLRQPTGADETKNQ